MVQMLNLSQFLDILSEIDFQLFYYIESYF